MKSVNIQKIDKKWQNFWTKKKSNLKNKKREKNFIA